MTRFRLVSCCLLFSFRFTAASHILLLRNSEVHEEWMVPICIFSPKQKLLTGQRLASSPELTLQSGNIFPSLVLIWSEVMALSEISHAVGLGPMKNMGYQAIQDTEKSIMLKSSFRAVNEWRFQYGSPWGRNLSTDAKMVQWLFLGLVGTFDGSFHGHVHGGYFRVRHQLPRTLISRMFPLTALYDFVAFRSIAFIVVYSHCSEWQSCATPFVSRV